MTTMWTAWLEWWPSHGWWASLPGRLLALAALLGAIGVIWKFATPPVRAAWLWFTRRRRLTMQLRRLVCGMQIEYFVHVLGQPAQYVNHLPDGEEVQYVFVFADAYVQVATDAHGKVGLFAVTTRSERFHPRLNYHPGGTAQMQDIRLGRTRFSDLAAQPDGVHSWVAARRAGYAESYYFGNPGHYQTYVLAINDAGVLSGDGHLGAASQNTTLNWFPSLGRPRRTRLWLPWQRLDRETIASNSDPYEEVGRWLTQPDVRAFRSNAVINTYAVVSDWMTLRLHRSADTWWGIPVGIGPDLDEVRIAPLTKRRRNLRRRLSMTST